MITNELKQEFDKHLSEIQNSAKPNIAAANKIEEANLSLRQLRELNIKINYVILKACDRMEPFFRNDVALKRHIAEKCETMK